MLGCACVCDGESDGGGERGPQRGWWWSQVKTRASERKSSETLSGSHSSQGGTWIPGYDRRLLKAIRLRGEPTGGRQLRQPIASRAYPNPAPRRSPGGTVPVQLALPFHSAHPPPNRNAVPAQSSPPSECTGNDAPPDNGPGEHQWQRGTLIRGDEPLPAVSLEHSSGRAASVVRIRGIAFLSPLHT